MYSKGIKAELEGFLSKVPRDLLELGPSEAAAAQPSAAAADLMAARDALVERLDRRLRIARSLVVVIVVCYLIAFGLVTTYALRQLDNAKLVPLVLGGSGSIVALIALLRSFWREITTLELLVALLPNVDPERAIAIVREWMYAGKSAAGAAAGRSRKPRTNPV